MALILTLAALAFLIGTVNVLLRALAGMPILPTTQRGRLLTVVYLVAAVLTGGLLLEATRFQ